MPDAPPRRRIELIQTLGQGGFGAVYLADVHGRDDFVQRLAVKVLSAEMSAEPDIAARQRDEARLLARLNHDHIVRVVDLTELDGRPAVLMEYVEGVDAGELLRRGPLPVKAALQIAAAAASALDAAWSSVGPRTGQPLRVIHRDIKPANLLVSRHGGVKVLDFGIARAEFDREGRTGSVQFGTARFMAPEQWLYGQASHKVDVYALGVSLVELLSGMHMERAPLHEDAFAAHMAAVRQAVGQDAWGPGLRAGVDGLLAAMLAFSPDDRPDAAEVHERVTWLIDHAPGEGLGRFARQVVPELLAARAQAQAGQPPPSLGPARPPPPAPVEAAPTRVLTPSQPTPAPRGDEPAAIDTLAVDRPAARRPGWVAGLAAGVAALLVLGAGLTLAWPALGPPDPAAAQATEAPSADPPGPSQPAADLAPTLPPAVVGQGPAEAMAVAAPRPEPASEAAPTPSTATPSSPRRASPASGTASPPPAAEPSPWEVASPAPASSPEAAASTDAAPSSLALDQPAPPASPGGAVPDPAAVAVTLSSTPWGAQVVIDGHLVGTTPLRGHELTVGTHTVTMAHGDQRSSRTITVGGRHPTSHTWTVESDQWRSSM